MFTLGSGFYRIIAVKNDTRNQTSPKGLFSETYHTRALGPIYRGLSIRNKCSFTSISIWKRDYISRTNDVFLDIAAH